MARQHRFHTAVTRLVGLAGVALLASTMVIVGETAPVAAMPQYLTQWGTQGSGDGEFQGPFAVALDPEGNVYVVDRENDRVQKFGPPRQPDARIKLGPTGTLKGDDVYNSTGRGQTSRGAVAHGGTVTYFVSVQNESPFPDALRLRGTASTSRFQVRYSSGGARITNAVAGGTYTTPPVDPGAAITVKVQVTALAGAPVGAALTGTLTAKSAADKSRKDTVRFVTTLH